MKQGSSASMVSRRWVNRALTAVVALLLLALLSLSTVLNVADEVLVGNSEPGPYTDPGIGRVLDGAVPSSSRDSRSGTPTVALTFDDGPDPYWTPLVLDVLAEHDVKATFFLIGEKVPANRDTVRRIVNEGHEIGLHSYNHPRMGDLSDGDVLRQYRLNQQVLVGTVGIKPLIARPPYSFTDEQLPADEYRAAHVAQDRGGITMIFSDVAPADYRGLSAEEIMEAAIPAPGRDAIITLHDGAGPDPGQTVGAIDGLIPELQKRGYEFATASEYGNVVGSEPATLEERVSSLTLVVSASLFTTMRDNLEPVALVVAPILIARFFGILLLSWLQDRRTRRRQAQATDRGRPGVSLIVPAYNEEVGIKDALLSFETLRYDGPLEVLVIDDGSTDLTAKRAREVPGVRVLSRPNGGKAAALNAGIAAATFEICVLVDGDTVFEPDTITRLIQPLEDPAVGAVSGYPKVGNRANLLSQMQNVEYILGCSLIRRAQERLGMITCLPGAIGAFRRSALLEVGGVPEHTMAEDTDLTMALGARGWKLSYAPDAVAWTEVPVDLRTFWKQRVRWSYGVFQVMWKHRKAAPGERNRRYRLSVLAYTLFDYLLAVMTPFADFFAILALLSGNAVGVALLVGLTFVAQAVTVAFAMRLDNEDLRSLRFLPAQLLFFRYFNIFVIGVALSSAISGRREKWNKPKRAGLNDVVASTPSRPVHIAS